jgi:hypothetical protein
MIPHPLDNYHRFDPRAQKQGLFDFVSERHVCPYPADSRDAKQWRYGYSYAEIAWRARMSLVHGRS